MIFKIVHGKEIHVLSKKCNFQELQQFLTSAFKKLPKNYTLSYLDAEGDNIAITSQSDLNILYQCFEGKVNSLRLVVTEVEDEKLGDDSFDELNEIQEKITEIPPQNKVEKPVVEESPKKVEPNIAELVQQKLMEIIPEITKQVTQSVESTISKSQIKSEVKSEVPPPPPCSGVVHERVTCDGCQKYPIIGNRYKCIICHNFDFCEECEAKGTHPHAFLKIRRPEQAPKVLVASMEDEREGIEINGNFIDGGMIQNLINTYAPRLPHCVNKFLKKMKVPTQPEQPKQAEVPKPKDTPKTECPPAFDFSDFEVPKKVEKKPVEVPKKEEKKSTPGEDEETKHMKLAYDLEQLFEEDYFAMMKFVKQNPTLSLEELAEKYVSRC